MIQATTTPKGMRNSIALTPLLAGLNLVFIDFYVLILRYFSAKKRLLLAAKPVLDAGHDARQRGFNDLVVRLPTLFSAGQEAASLH